MFSKAVVTVSGAFFFFGILLSVLVPMDSALAIAVISASGSIFLTTVVWYYKKAEAENVRKIMTGYYKDSMDVRYNYNKKMIKLMKDNNLTENDLNKIANSSQIDEISDGAFEEGKEKLQERADDSMTIPTVEHPDTTPVG